MNISDLHAGAIRHESFPDEFIERVKNFKRVLAEVEPSSLESTIDGFKRDENPETELAIWERIAATYQWAVAGIPGLTEEQKKEVFTVLLCVSMNTIDVANLQNISTEQATAIISHYNSTKA